MDHVRASRAAKNGSGERGGLHILFLLFFLSFFLLLLALCRSSSGRSKTKAECEGTYQNEASPFILGGGRGCQKSDTKKEAL